MSVSIKKNTRLIKSINHWKQLELTYDICDCGIAGNANAFGGHLLAGILKVEAHNAMEEQVLKGIYSIKC